MVHIYHRHVSGVVQKKKNSVGSSAQNFVSLVRQLCHDFWSINNDFRFFVNKFITAKKSPILTTESNQKFKSFAVIFFTRAQLTQHH